MKRTGKKALAILLTLCMCISLLAGLPVTAGAIGGPDPVIPAPGTTYDVFLSKSGSVPYDINDLAAKVGEKLGTLIGSGNETYRIKTATNSIDTTDLSGWYVYDHYDTAHYANQAAWEAVYGASSLMRPYQPYTEIETNNKATLAEMSATDLTAFTTVRQLDQHIYSYTGSDGKPAMLFAGYGEPDYTDFLFYPATSAGSKTVNFTVNSAYVNTHTLLGMGFLLNTGIDDQGYIHGYVLYYEFESESSIDSIALYTIDNNVLASDFAKEDYCYFSDFCTDPVTIASNPTWESLMDIQLTIDPTSVKVEQKASSEENYTTIGTEELTSTGYQGFGPLVQYDSHGCPDNSLFVFSKLAMSFQADSGDSNSSLLAPLQNAEFYDDSANRVFVNLLPEDYGTVTDADKAILAVMRSKEIKLITNYTGSSSYYPTTYLGSNAVDLNTVTAGTYFDNTATTYDGDVAKDKAELGSGISLDNLAANIAAAIYNKTYTAGQGTDPASSTLTDSAAALVLRTSADADGEIHTILNGLIPDDGVKVYLDTTGSYQVSKAPSFTILKPGASEAVAFTPTTDDSGSYFTVTGEEADWPAGDYAVTVSYEGNVLPATRTFKIAYSVQYAVDNGNTTPTLAAKYLNVPLTLADASGFTAPDNCTFAGWLDSGSGKMYASAASYSGNANLNLTAKWQLAKPENVQLTAEDGALTLTWNAVTGATGYTVQFYQDGEPLGEPHTITEGTTDSLAADGYTIPDSGLTRIYATVSANSEIENIVPNTATSTKVLVPAAVTAPGGTFTEPYYTQENVNEVFGTTGEAPSAVPNATLTGDETNGFVITLDQNIRVDNTIDFPADVTLNLNGKYIIGADGADGTGSGDGADGKDAVKVTAGTLTVAGPGSLNGGNGGNGGPDGGNGGKGGSGIGNATTTPEGSIVLKDNAAFNGGDGGTGVNNGADGRQITGIFENVTVESGDITLASDPFIGFAAMGDITISGGTVNAEGGECGLCARGDIIIRDGTVNAEGGECGLYAGGDIIISGGTVNAEGGICGMQADGGMTISGGTVDAEGSACGIYAGTGINLNGMTISSPVGAKTGEYSDGYTALNDNGPVTTLTITKAIDLGPAKVPVIVDGVAYNIGTAVTENGVTTVTIDQEELQKQLDTASKTVVVPVNTTASTAVAQLVVSNVDDMADKQMTLSITVDGVSYDMRAVAIDTETLLKELGATDAAKVPVNVTIKKLSNSAVTLASGTLMVNPVSFTVTATYGGKTAQVEVFQKYVQRVIEIPSIVDASKITTAVVVENGTQRHVPTEVFQQGGKWYARINSLTNSTYALIYNEVSFSDIDGKWYNAVVTEMASRGIINGYSNGTFGGDKSITRAEFAAILVRALGLPQDGDASMFTDVASTAWYYGAVGKAYEYGLVNGRTATIFDPNANITRQEAMAMVHRAAAITELTGSTGSLAAFSDASSIGAWAKADAEWNVGTGLIQGNSAGKINGKANITRGETATIILRLLQKSGLVDVRTEV